MAGETGTPGGTARKMPRLFSWKVLPWVILAVSVALNVFFVGGHVYGRHVAKEIIKKERPQLAQFLERRREMRKRIRTAMRDLDLSREQRQEFRQMRRDLAQSGRQLRRKNRVPMGKLWSEFESGTPDQTKVESLLREMADNRYAFQLEATRRASGFMAKLTPEQRKKFAVIARERDIFARLGGPNRGRGKDGKRKDRKPPPDGAGTSGGTGGDPRKED